MDFIDTIESHCTTNKVAHIYRNSNLTYRELKTKSDSLAVNIIELFGKDKTLIIIFGHKDHLLLISFLACVKSGHPYIPMDTSTPSARLKDIVSISGAKLIINISDDLIDTPTITILNESKIGEVLVKHRNEIPDVNYRIKDEEVYYIIYTSGSTGKPKGVQITKNCIQSFINWSINLIDKEDKTFMNQAPFSFDLSVMDTYFSLLSGSILYSIDKEMIANLPQLFIDFRSSKIEIVNFYGPTEATVAVTAVKIKKEMKVVEKKGYRTGDAGHIIDGLLYYDGRIDNQIKLHGYRVEIEDIENNMRKLPFIKNAIVVPIRERDKIQYLSTAIVLNYEFKGNIVREVKNSLKDLLPSYMIPRKIMVMEALPMNGNGKIDRKKIMEEF